ncbi:hypothetical protein ACTNAL_15045 [Bariatricus sp. HCP28S3_B10]|uniref:hypothetical protein n=1 Tax=Lachnospiraceae TaxID=186803 RepID=UPI003CFF53DE
MHWLFIGGFIAAVIYMILVFSDRADNFLGGLCLGITFGMMIVGAIMTSKYAAQIRAFKMRISSCKPMVYTSHRVSRFRA